MFGKRKDPMNDTGDFLAGNVRALASVIGRHANFGKVERKAIIELLSKETTRSLQMKFLTQFDFRRTDVLSFPDEFYR